MVKSRVGEQNTGSAGQDNVPPARSEPGGLLGRFGALLPRRRYVDVPATPTKGTAARNQQNGATPAPAQQRLPMGRILIGFMAYLVGSIVLQYVLIWLSVTYKLHLERTQALFPRNTPLLGSMSTYSLVYLLFLIALIWGLYRFNVLPRNLFGTRAAAQRNAAPVDPTSNGNRRSAAARRARRASQASATTSAPSAAKASARPATTPTRRAPAQTPATKATKMTNGNDDEVYERVKALQRSRRRKK
jgi:hypothetical protein